MTRKQFFKDVKKVNGILTTLEYDLMRGSCDPPFHQRKRFVSDTRLNLLRISFLLEHNHINMKTNGIRSAIVWLEKILKTNGSYMFQADEWRDVK